MLIDATHSLGVAQKVQDMNIDWQELTHYIEEATIASGIRGLTLALSVAGEQRFIHADGEGAVCEYRDEQKFGLGCVSRTLVAVLALKMQEQRLLDIDAPVSKYMSELSDDERFNVITLRHLLQHTAGYGGIGYGEQEGNVTDVGSWLPMVRYAPQIFVPGTVVDYEGSNSLLASEILKRVGGQPIGVQLEKCISSLIASANMVATLPLRNSQISGAQSPQKYVSGNDDILDQIMNLRVGLGDLLAIGEVICRESMASACQPVLAALYRNAIPIPRAVSEAARAHMPTGYGLGTCAFPNDLFGHDGHVEENYLSFRFCPTRKMVVALGVDTESTEMRNAFRGGLLSRLGVKCEPVVVKHKETFELSELSGRYLGNNRVNINVTAEPGSVTIHLHRRGGGKKPLRGEIGSMDRLNFPPEARMWSPTFFREPGTGCPCLMMGNNAFKRMSAQPSRLQGKLTVLT